MTVLVNMAEVWSNGIDDAIDYYEDYLDFSSMEREEFKEECIKVIAYYFDNEMIGLEINYRDIVSDTAAAYEIWEG